MSTTSVYVQGETQLPPTSPGDPPRPAGGVAKAPIKLLLLPLVSVRVRFFCEPFSSEVSISCNSVEFLQSSPAGLQIQMLWGFLFPVLDPWARGPEVGLRILIPV